MCKKFFSLIIVTALLILSIGSTQIFFPSEANAVSSEAYTWNNVQMYGGGYVPGVIFNTAEKNLIYARTDIGGAYRWNESTQSWKCITDSVGWVDWNKNGVDALATDPVEPNRVYMATGTYTNDWDTTGQIMRSTDRGETWKTTALPFKVGGNMPGRGMGERLVIDPNKNSILFFGARSGNGLWKSTDYGTTWSKVTSFTNVGTYIPNPGQVYGSDPVGISWITFDPRSGSSGSATQTIYAGIADLNNSVFRSTDGGSTWTAVSGQPTGYIPHHGVLSSTGMLYISYSNGAGPYDGSKGDVWKFNTSTGVWTSISPVPSSSSDNYYGYGGLAVDAQNPDTIMIATLNCWWPEGILFRSTDGGATWTRSWDWVSYPTRSLRYTLDISNTPWLNFGVNGVATSENPSPKIGWMMDDLEIDPFNSNRMMYGTGATIYGTNNLNGWDSRTVTISPMAKGIEETAVCALISPTAGTAHLISGLGDISGFYHESLTAVQSYGFTQPTFVSTTGIDYAESNPNYMVRVGSVDRSYTTNKACGFSYSGGTNWFSTNTEPPAVREEGDDPSTPVGPSGGQVAVSADGTTVVWSPNKTTAVYYTTDNGNSWTACSGLPAKAEICSDRVNANKFYGFKDGKFYISTDKGRTFTATAAAGLPVNVAAVVHGQAEKPVCIFKAMPGAEGDIWFAGGSTAEGTYGLWHSTDSGASFTKLSNVQEADTIGFGKAAEGQNYMALYTTAKIDGVRGIFRSDNGGASWVRINDDQHQYAKINMCITGDPRIYGRVYVGTNGRGIVYGDSQATPVNNSSITPTTATFDKKTANQADISVSMTLNGNTLSAVKNGAATLVSGTDYTVSGTTLTVKKAYLAAQAVGTTNLTFDFSGGVDPVLAVNVIDTTSVNNSAITPTTATFDKKTANQADIAISVTLNGNTLNTVRNGSAALVSGTDYSVTGTTVTIKKAYLALQALGTTNLTFDFSAGTDPVLAISILDSSQQAGALKVQMFNGTTAATSNTLNPKLKLINTGTTPVTLSNVKIRYYYTIDGEKAQSFWCDWSTAGSANVTGSFTKMPTAKTGADYYLEIGFTTGAGIIAAGDSIEIQTRVSKNDWSNYTQTGDYSFMSSGTSYSDWTNVTEYVSGALVWGVEP
ncbi:MAG: xeg74 [Eubacterium sp.]|jgi:hypothetical protein|nr:xeg74 [Eubacterium sp.]